MEPDNTLQPLSPEVHAIVVDGINFWPMTRVTNVVRFAVAAALVVGFGLGLLVGLV